MFGLFKKSFNINFNDELQAELQSALTEMNRLLMNEGNKYQANWIKRILASILDNNTKRFKSLVISAELLGGSGSVIDCYLGSDEQQQTFDRHFNKFLNLTLQSGLTHRAVKQAERMTSRNK